MPSMTIGPLGQKAGVKIETIRYYEKIGLIPAPPRTASGHRIYGHKDLTRLRFIRRARELGFPLETVRKLLGIDEAPLNCGEANKMAQHQLTDVRERIADLRKLEARLVELSSHCAGGDSPECAFVEALFDDAPWPPSA